MQWCQQEMTVAWHQVVWVEKWQKEELPRAHTDGLRESQRSMLGEGETQSQHLRETEAQYPQPPPPGLPQLQDVGSGCSLTWKQPHGDPWEKEFMVLHPQGHGELWGLSVTCPAKTDDSLGLPRGAGPGEHMVCLSQNPGAG